MRGWSQYAIIARRTYAVGMHARTAECCWIVFGATGAVGRRVRSRLHAQAASVLALSRFPQVPEVPGERWQRIDLYRDPPPGLRAAGVVLSAGPLDGLAACAARADWPPGTRIVALSSLSVETKHDSIDPYERGLADRLRAAETELIAIARARGWHLHLLRASLIYDPQYGGLALDRVALLAKRLRVLPLPRNARGLRQPVHADDLAAALLRVVECAPASSILRLPGGETLRFDVMLRRWLQAHASRARVLPVPAVVGLVAAKAFTLFGGTAAVLAAQLARARVDQCVGLSDWTQLGLTPRRFLSSGEGLDDCTVQYS